MNLKFRLSALALFGLGLSAAPAAIPNTITFTNAFMNGTTGVTFRRPVFFAEVPGRDSNYIVLEQFTGNGIVVHKRAGLWVKDTMFHVNAVSTRNEMGLLSVAFHPDYVNNRKYYIFYSHTFNATSDDCATNSPGCGINVIEEHYADTSLIKDAGIPARTVLRLYKSAMNHNGSDIHFHPVDGYLYIGIGDGGDPQGDAPGRGQNPDTLLGKFLRIDVNTSDAFLADTNRNYGVPADNPFVNTPGYRPEIWARGLRNPWRWSFDRLTHTAWIGEVGNATREEVDTLAKGANLGWRLMEGKSCQPGVSCSPAGLTLPVYDYPHSGGGDTSGEAVIGGYVYRGNPASPYYGLYFFGNNANGRVWVMRRGADGFKQELINLHPNPSSSSTVAVTGLSAFGEDSHGSLYALGWTSNTNGTVFHLDSPDLVPAVTVGVRSARLPPALSAAGWRDFQAHPEAYDVTGLDGRRLSGSFHGTALIRKKGSRQPPQLVPFVW